MKTGLVLSSLATVLLAVWAPHVYAVDWITIGGYVKSFAVVIDEPSVDAPGGTIAGDWLWANNNRGRLNLGADLGDHLRFDAAYEMRLQVADDRLFTGQALVFFPEFPVYRFADLETRIWPDEVGEGDHVALLQNLDRFYATLSLPFADLLVGRQSIAWGSAHAVNPTDIIAIFTYNEIDIEDRRGVDAVRLRVPTGALGEIDAGYVAGKDFKWSQSAAYLRGRTYALETDVAMLAMVFREHLMVGADLARNVGGAGTWIEAAYVWANTFDDRSKAGDAMDYLRLSMGAEYNFNLGNGLYTFLEYHFNGAGSGDPDDYIDNVRANPAAYGDGTVYLLGRHYLIPGLSYQLTPLVTLAVQSLFNLNDGSLLAAPSAEYNVTENLYLTAGAFAAIGANPELGPPVYGYRTEPVLGSEFGTYGSQYFVFLQYYY